MRWSTFIVALLAMLGASAFAQPRGSLPISSAALEAKAREACRGPVTIAPDALTSADLDGDGKLDALFNWAKVECQSKRMDRRGAGFCGMHNCSIDIYFSSQYRPGGWPKPILNHIEIDPQLIATARGMVLRTSYQGGSCPFAQVCQREWSWNGSKMVSREIAGEAPATPAKDARPLEVTRANLVGRWVDAGDGCATDAVLSFAANGDYASYEQNGDWRLVGDRIAIVVRETYTLGEAGSTRPVANPKAVMLSVLSLSASQLRVRDGKGGEFAFRRCE